MTAYIMLAIVVGVVFLVYVALKHHRAVRAFFGCPYFNFSIEAGSGPDDKEK